MLSYHIVAEHHHKALGSPLHPGIRTWMQLIAVQLHPVRAAHP